MRPQDVVATVEPERWDAILTAVREHAPELWRDLERGTMADQRVPPKLWQRYSTDQRRTAMRRTLRAPGSARLALDAVREYLLVEQRPLLVRFLDELGIPHENGALGEDPLEEPEPARLDAAIDALVAEFPRADVLLYLRTFSAHESAPWPHLAERLAALEQEPEGSPPTTPTNPRGGGGGGAPAPAAPRASASQPAAPALPAEPPPRPDSAPPSAGARPPASPPRTAGTVAERRGSPGRERPPPPRRGAARAPRQELSPAAAVVPDVPPGAPAAAGSPSPATARAALAAPPAWSSESAAASPAARPAVVASVSSSLPALPNADLSPTNSSNLQPPSAAPASQSPTETGPNVDVRPDRAWDATALRPTPAPGAYVDDARPDRLTPLDVLLERTVAASLSHVRGAPTLSEVRAVVDEVLHLSAHRPQSCYHVGLLEALAGSGQEPDRGGWSAACWDWYHYGRLVGWTRQERWSEVARFYAGEPAAARRLLHSPEGMAPWAGPRLFDGLLAADMPSRAAEVLREFSGVAPLADCAALLDAAVTRLEDDRASEACDILDVLRELRPLAVPGPMDDARERAAETLGAYCARLRRAEAQAAQAQGLFGPARALLEAALAAAEGPERADLLGDLGLVVGEFSRLADVRLPEADADPRAWIRRLEAGAAYFAEAVAIAPYQSPAA
ncbi:MAG TPA: hypothetical protein VFE37_01285, partial [Chloroflexota bacterium]|nr:hypothetical protein [Chloroflexota bacterium]